MSKFAKHLLIACCITILPAFLAVGSNGDTLPELTAVAHNNPGNGPHPSTVGTVIYSNFGQNYSFSCCTGWTVSEISSSASTSNVVATEFSSSGSFSVGQIDVGVGWVTGADNGVMVSLWTDSNNVPGTELGSWSASNIPGFAATSNGVATISDITGVRVQAGADYFLELSSPNNSWDAWSFNSLGIKGLVDQKVNGVWNPYMTYDLGAFDILADPASQDTPEPATLTLLGVGMLALGGVLRRKAFRD